MLTHGADSESVVTLRARIIVFQIDPTDKGLGSFAVVEGVGQSADLLGNADEVAQELLVAVVAVVVKVELVGDGEQRGGVIVADGVICVSRVVIVIGSTPIPDAFFQYPDSFALGHTVLSTTDEQDLTTWLESRPRLSSNSVR
ncbi:hypothetical protein ZOD2009_02425 [Haladaptatus paucihalophilus DX253]|uniref:Uncharacterized protein n=1 Tax=Haladaptatus paucihalophilus DX253 TaxID=797209 RepID=E7QNG7_HALPU|nr:hypothetical protein ZOD2009_02425 [Haladaptatus paucihalophilus DX253]